MKHLNPCFLTNFVQHKYLKVLLGKSGTYKCKCILKPVLSQNMVHLLEEQSQWFLLLKCYENAVVDFSPSLPASLKLGLNLQRDATFAPDPCLQVRAVATSPGSCRSSTGWSRGPGPGSWAGGRVTGSTSSGRWRWWH